MDIPRMKVLFIDLYLTICDKGFIEHNLITMGNFSVFLDQELLLLIAREVYQLSKQNDLDENLEYRMKRITDLYKTKKLNHFDLILDEYYFPDWFKGYMPFLQIQSIQVMCAELIKILKKNEVFEVPEWGVEDVSRMLEYINRKYNHERKWAYLLPLIDAIQNREMGALKRRLETEL
jgi:hypothetical protein